MTHHEHPKEPEHSFDPDFDAALEAPAAHHAPHHAQKQVTFSLSLTPTKIFLGGFVVGLLLMGIPAAFLYAKAGGVSVLGQAAAPSPLAAAAAAQPGAPKLGTVKGVSAIDHLRGNKNAKVTAIVYSDMECPFCKAFHPTIQQAFDDYKGQISWVYRHFPLSFHQNAQKEAEAAECVASIGGEEKFWKFLDTVFQRTTSTGTGIALTALGPLAKEIGVDQQKFQTCLDSGKMAARVNTDLQEGQAAGIDGTPGTILIASDGNKVLVPGAVPASELKSQIDALLK